MSQIRANYDEPWKEALTEYFEQFLFFFFPSIHQLINWEKIPESLDKELQRVTASSKAEKRYADKLYKVWLVSGEEMWVLIHIEIQSQYEEEFPQRMYIYNYRAFDLNQKPVISLAILGDERADWQPESYNHSLGGCEVTLKFPIVKLLSYEAKWSELEESNNPLKIEQAVDKISVLSILDELLKVAIKVDCFEEFHKSLVKLSPKVPESNESDKS